MKLIGYIRVSTSIQAEDGVSLDDQRRRIAAWCEAMDHELVRVHVDAGVSGTLHPDKRDGLTAALADVRSGAVDGLVVVKLDRLTRSTRDALDMADESCRKGWALVSVAESLDTSSPLGKFVLTILAAINQLERDRIAERTRDAMAHVASEGRARSGRVPFGFRCEGHPDDLQVPAGGCSLVEHEGETRILRRIRDLRRAGLGARKICRWLNDAEVENPRTGREWNPGTMASIIRTAERREAAQ